MRTREIRLKTSPEEMTVIRRRAESMGMTTSGYLRFCGLRLETPSREKFCHWGEDSSPRPISSEAKTNFQLDIERENKEIYLNKLEWGDR